MAAAPSLGLSTRFNVLKGLTVGYGASARFNVHSYTTGGRDAPTIADCRGVQCAELVNTGVRNAWLQQSHSASLGLGLTKTWSIGTNVGFHLSHLYAEAGADEVSYTPSKDTSSLG